MHDLLGGFCDRALQGFSHQTENPMHYIGHPFFIFPYTRAGIRVQRVGEFQEGEDHHQAIRESVEPLTWPFGLEVFLALENVRALGASGWSYDEGLGEILGPIIPHDAPPIRLHLEFCMSPDFFDKPLPRNLESNQPAMDLFAAQVAQSLWDL